MNKKIIFIIILMFITVNIVFARECTSTFIFEDLEDVSYHAGTTYEMDKGLCRYYDDHPNEMPNELETMLEENQCYVTMYFEEFPKPLTYYNGKMYDEETGHCKGGLLSDGFVPNAQNQVHEEDAAGGNDPSMDDSGLFDFLKQDNLNLAKVVQEINKGELAQQFREAYNLKTLKAAAITTNDNNEMLVIQFIPDGSNSITTVKINYDKNGKNSNISATITASDTTKQLLAQFPFWILEAAPEYPENGYVGKVNEALVAAFNSITNYQYTKNGNNYVVSAIIPDDINAQVLAVYSDFLDKNPLAEFNAERAAASTEGQDTSDKTTTKKKNPKTGAFANVKVIGMGFVIAFIGGYLFFRYSKIKKI